MRVAAFAQPGPPDVLQLMEKPDPEAAAGQVRVSVRTAGVQPFDTAMRGGMDHPVYPVTLPQVLGNEFAGVVDQVGDGVTDFEVGDEVLGWAVMACYAELLTVDAAQVVHKPADMPWCEAGALSGTGQTAHTALRELGVGAGHTVLIHAAAGGVGTMAVQIAKAWGADLVIGTASEGNHEYLRSLGATPVTYGDTLVEQVRALAPDGVDAVLDGIGGEALTQSLELVEDPARIATLVEFGAGEKHGVKVVLSQRSKDRLQELVDLWAEGRLRVHVSETVPFARAADAHRLSESGHVRGKVVVEVWR